MRMSVQAKPIVAMLIPIVIYRSTRFVKQFFIYLSIDIKRSLDYLMVEEKIVRDLFIEGIF